ncbi:MAG: DNA transformation protein [Oceanicoccus sp.]|jgi:DNA transformation protein
MQSDLLALKNLGNTSINWLRAIGINCPQDLYNVGAVEAYLQIKQRGIRVSKVLLYALHGAMIDTHWSDLDINTKQQLLEQADSLAATEQTTALI